MGGKVCLRCKGKTLLGFVNKLFVLKSLLIMPSNVLPLHLKQTFLPIIFTEGEGDGIESRLPFKTFSTVEKWQKNLPLIDEGSIPLTALLFFVVIILVSGLIGLNFNISSNLAKLGRVRPYTIFINSSLSFFVFLSSEISMPLFMTLCCLLRALNPTKRGLHIGKNGLWRGP